MKIILTLLALSLFSACGIPRISNGTVSVTGLKDAGKPATLTSDETKSGVVIPKGTEVKITETDAVPATDKTAFIPARKEVSFIPAFDTKLESISTKFHADTGTVDTSIALKKIQASENRIWLYASLVSAVLAGVLVYIKYPTPALTCGAGAVVFFMVWKLSDLPDWFYVVGVAAVAGGVMLWRGHVRGENDGIKAAVTGDVIPPIPKVP